jgi:hypothetical protein
MVFDPISLGLAGLALKLGTGAAAKGALVGGAKAGCTKAAVGMYKATHAATTYAATYGPGAIGATATTAILGTCYATTTMVAIAACLSQAVRLHGMSENSAQRYCRKISEKSSAEQEQILSELQAAPSDEVRAVLSRHGISSRAALAAGAGVLALVVMGAALAGVAGKDDDD